MLDKLQQINNDANNVPPKVTRAREDLRNTNTRSDQFGRPLDLVDINNLSTRNDAQGRPIN